MASAISKQEMRRNVLGEWVASTVRFLQSRRTMVLTVLVVAAVIGALAAGYWWYRERREADAARALAASYSALRGEEPGKPGTTDEALRLFREVVEQHRGSQGAEEALIALGNLQYEAGKADEAAAIYNEYLTTYPRGRLRIMAGLGKAYAQEAKGDLQAAAQTLSDLVERDKDNPLAGEAFMSLARVYEGLKQPEDAMRIYGEVVEQFSQTNWAQQALQRMSTLKTR